MKIKFRTLLTLIGSQFFKITKYNFILFIDKINMNLSRKTIVFNTLILK